jgi:FkbH-like protein
VFVDDNPMELAEVQAAHPDITCLQFPNSDYGAALALLTQLRDAFGRRSVIEEDLIRRESLRAATPSEPLPGAEPANADSLLRGIDATIAFSLSSTAENRRALELVNKTNQFNLNGARATEADWHAMLGEPGAFVLSASYQDRFGPLGTIAVVKGIARDGVVLVDTWVMSCRAFARRIEHQCLRLLFDHFAAREVTFAFAATPRNEPIQQFFRGILGAAPTAPFTVAQTQYLAACPPLYHTVTGPQ